MTQIKSGFNPSYPWLRLTLLANLLEGSLVLFEFLPGLAEFALRGQSLVILKLLDCLINQLL